MPRRSRSAGSSAELAAARSSRVAAHRHAAQERYLHYLDVARRTRIDNGFDPSKLDAAIKQGQDELEDLAEVRGGRVVPRRKARHTISGNCNVFIDECGAHTLSTKEAFGAFCLAAVVVRDEDGLAFDRRWKRWKREYLGSSTKRIHEPDIRRGSGSFWCDGDATSRVRAVGALGPALERLPFLGFVCVVNRLRYRETIGEGPWDESLPQHIYLMAVDFLMERLALALDLHLGGLKARVLFESRGPREDAALQYEFARLFLDGTTYLASSYFRHQFFPGVEFRNKEDNITGLQVADLLARPCGEKVLEPSSSPPRWANVKAKLCPEIETEHSILGLKIVPWEEQYVRIWKS